MNNTELRQIYKDSSIWGESFWRRKYEIEIKPFFKMANLHPMKADFDSCTLKYYTTYTQQIYYYTR